MLTSALALLVGGFLASRDYGYAYGLQILAGVLSLLSLLRLPEPSRAEANQVAEGRGDADAADSKGFTESCHTLLTRPAVARVLVYGTLLWSGLNLYYLLLQPGLADKGAGPDVVSVLFSLGDTTVAVGSLAAAYILARLGRWNVLVVVPAIAACVAVWVPNASLTAFALLHLLVAFSEGVGEPVLDNVLNQDLEDHYRATVLSVQSALSSGIVLVGFPLAGWLAEKVGFQPAFGLAFALLTGAVVSGALLKIHRSKALVVQE